MTVYLWPTFADEFGLELVSVTADGTPVPIDPDHRRVHLEDASWSMMHLELRATTAEITPGGVQDLGAHVVVSSPRSILRSGYPLTTDHKDGAIGFTGTLDLPRSDLSGAVDIAAVVTGMIDSRRRVVGGSGSWRVVVDASEAPKPPGAPPFKVKKQDFATSDAPLVVRDHVGELAYFELSDPPVLWINDGIDGLWALLHAAHAKDDRRRQRDVASATIARVVLSTVFRSAVDDLTFGYLDEPSRQIQRDLCTEIVAHLPAVDDATALYEQIKKFESLDGEARDDFWSHVDLALDHISGLSTALTRNINEVKHG